MHSRASPTASAPTGTLFVGRAVSAVTRPPASSSKNSKSKQLTIQRDPCDCKGYTHTHTCGTIKWVSIFHSLTFAHSLTPSPPSLAPTFVCGVVRSFSFSQKILHCKARLFQCFDQKSPRRPCIWTSPRPSPCATPGSGSGRREGVSGSGRTKCIAV